MSVIQGNALGSPSYQIANSVRFRSSASSSLTRTTAASGGDRDKWWIFFHFKRGALGAIQYLHGADTASADACYFNASDQFCVDIAGTARLVSTRVFRDPTAHGAFLIVYDASNGTAAQRLRVYYVDNSFSELTAWGTDTRSAITAGTAKTMHNSIQHVIGKSPTAASGYLDGVLSEHRIGTWSGSQPTPSNFGGLDVNGVWVPSGASTAYGTSGSFLKFNDGTSATTLGYDRSGNANNWTPSGISTTAGVTYDWMTDTPTNNYAVLNALDKASDFTVANANLSATSTSVPANNVLRATVGVSSGKWYWEVLCNTSAAGTMLGVMDASDTANTSTFPGNTAITYGYYGNNGNKYNSTGSAYGSTFTGGDVIGCALDLDNGKIWWSKNGTWQASGDPAAGTNAAFTGLSGTKQPAVGDANSAASVDVAFNFGQRPFTYTPPTGFKALCTANRPTGSITASGSFTGNAAADGPFVWLNGNPSTMTINGNAVTWGTHADKTAGGFKVRSSSASYNASGSNTYSVSVTGKLFGDIAHAPNTAQGNP